MEKILCFEIENKKLFLDKSLIKINYVPIFYTCKDNNENIYIVICTNMYIDKDISEDTYIIAESNSITIQDMLNKKITMREAVTSGSKFWKVETSDEIKDDKVEETKLNLIEDDYLPDKNYYYQKQWRWEDIETQ